MRPSNSQKGRVVPHTALRQLLSLGKEAAARPPRGLPSSAHARNISITTCLDAYLLTAIRNITSLPLTLLHLLKLEATFAMSKQT